MYILPTADRSRYFYFPADRNQKSYASLITLPVLLQM